MINSVTAGTVARRTALMAGVGMLMTLSHCREHVRNERRDIEARRRPAGADPAAGLAVFDCQAARPASVHANELGVIPVLMYHRLVTTKPGSIDVTTDDFSACLTRMLADRYRPVPMSAVANGALDVEAGCSPYVLTFDDGTPSQLRLTRDGSIDPTCAAGLILSACTQADVTPAATFYVNRGPFGAKDPAQVHDVLQAAIGAGFEIGNHTYAHPNLAHLSDAEVQRQIVLLQRMVRQATGSNPTTLALPFGNAPRHRALASEGVWDGESYQYDAVLLAGAGPSPSPFSRQYSPHSVPRISDVSSSRRYDPYFLPWWLDTLDSPTGNRYVSAGRPGKVTFPRAESGQLATRYAARAVVY